jgi:hypothetical protein
MNRKPFTEIACSADKVGAIVLRGIYGGAICSHYRIASIANGEALYVPVVVESVRNADGSFSSAVRDAV